MSEVRVVVVGEAWGEHEAAAGRPFVGPSGTVLSYLLDDAGLIPRGMGAQLVRALQGKHFNERDNLLSHCGIHLTNVFNLRPPRNAIEALCGPRWGALPPIRPNLWLREEYIGEVQRLRAEIAELKPNLVVGLGATALWAALGTGQISKHRGTIAASSLGKFIATWHPAYLLRGNWADRAIALIDLKKAAREAAFPEIRRTPRFVYVPESPDDLHTIHAQCAAAPTLAIDIETDGPQITCIGFAWSPNAAACIPIYDRLAPDKSYWWGHNAEGLAWATIRRICALPMPKVFQNGLYDLHRLWRGYGIRVINPQHDTMLLHHSLQPELQKGLGFLGSIYLDEVSWKTMRPRHTTTFKREDE